jgi:uncharacterized membrane protein/plastocyanin
MRANFSKKDCLLAVAAMFFLAGALPAFAQTPAAECRIEVCYVKMTANGFVPESIAVKPGATVVWKNVDEKVHSLEIIAGQARGDAAIIGPGESYSYAFRNEEPVEFAYFDAENGKSGTLLVGSVEKAAQVNRSKIDFTDSRSGISDISMIRGSVTGVEIIPAMRALLVNVDVQSHDVLQMTIDRDLLDSRTSDKDAPFSVRAGGVTASYDEIATTAEARTLRIALPAGTESVLVKGNSIAEEPLGYQSAHSVLAEAASVIAAYKSKGIVTKEADDLLLQATDAAALGKYHFATDLAREAVTAAQRADRIAVVATSVMNEAETSIMATKTLGGDVSQAEELLDHTKEVYSYGGYEEALNLANYAKDAALTKINPLLVMGVIGMSAAAVLYTYYRKLSWNGKAPAAPTVKQDDGPSLQSVFVEKPHLREDDRQVLKYIVDRGGEALLAEIRNQFELPKSTAWRLMRRLEREELVEIAKFGNQNMVRYKLRTEAQS